MTRKGSTVPQIAEQLDDAALPEGPHPFPDPALVRYESRIRVVEAWQYHGTLTTAPPWIDRSWAAWGEFDQERKINPGPALRVPITSGHDPSTGSGEKMARVDDYVVRQEVTLALGVAPDAQIDVWRKEEFEKFFLPQRVPAEVEPASKETP